MPDYKALLAEVEQQEEKLVFERFDAEMALEIGLALIEEAKCRNAKICTDISAFGRRLFHFSSTGSAPSNDIWIERKNNTVNYTGHSSLHAHYTLADLGMTIAEKWLLDPSQYAQVGGGFPIRVKGCGGVVGTITVSGFPHEEDHGIIVEVLASYLGVSL